MSIALDTFHAEGEPMSSAPLSPACQFVPPEAEPFGRDGKCPAGAKALVGNMSEEARSAVAKKAAAGRWL